MCPVHGVMWQIVQSGGGISNGSWDGLSLVWETGLVIKL